MARPHGRRPARAVAHGEPARSRASPSAWDRTWRARSRRRSCATRCTRARDTCATCVLARPGVLPFLALIIVLTWVLARRAYGEAAAWIAAVVVSCIAGDPRARRPGDDRRRRSPPPSCSRCCRCCAGSSSRRADARDPGRAGARAGGRDQVLGARAARCSRWSRSVARRSLGPRPGSARRLLAQAPLMGLGASAGRVGRLSLRGRRAGVAVAAGLAAGHASTPAFRRTGARRAADWLLAHRLPAPGAVPRGARAVRARRRRGDRPHTCSGS